MSERFDLLRRIPPNVVLGFVVFGLSLVMLFIPPLRDSGTVLLPLSVGWLMGAAR